MDKLTLNNQIVLCRPAVRKAKVCLIRKKIKKIKILKSCKKEDDIEKKNKKAERLLEEVQLMKKVREDDVTKFALNNKDVKNILLRTPANDHDHVYATLASYPDVQKQVEKTRDLFPSWETTLPSLLESLGTRSLMKKAKVRSKGMMLAAGENPTRLLPRTDVKDESEPNGKDIIRNPLEINEKGQSSEDELPEAEKEEEIKVVDSFFVDKKVIQPKLLSEPVRGHEGSEEDEGFNERDKFWATSEPRRDNFRKRDPPRKYQREERTEWRPPMDKPAGRFEQKEEKLHPSWAAKRAQVTQPFQGKKIKFTDD